MHPILHWNDQATKVQTQQFDSHIILLGHEFVQRLSPVRSLSVDIVNASRKDSSLDLWLDKGWDEGLGSLIY